jgi:HSP20 family molecular chaperone IbpA
MTSLVIRRPSPLDEFEGMTQRLWGTWEPWIDGHYMRLDVQEMGDELVLKAELLGVTKEGFSATIDREMLRIEAEKKAEEEVKEHTYSKSSKTSKQH